MRARMSLFLSVLLDLLLQPNLDERLIRHVTGVGCHFDRIEQVLRQTQRDRLGRGFQVRQHDALSLRPVQIFRRVAALGFPEGALFRLVLELW